MKRETIVNSVVFGSIAIIGGLVVANMFGVFNSNKTANVEQKLTIKGSTSVEPFIKALKEELKDEYKITLSAQGSGTGISALFDNKTDIAMSSRDLKPEEEEKAKKQDITKTEIAKDGISVIVNKELPIVNLTKKQLQDIYNGKIKNWKDIDGKTDQNIIVVARDEASGTREGFDKLLNIKSLPSDAQQIEATQEVIRNVNENKGAIGYVSSGSSLNDVKVESVDNVKPSEENIKTKKYQLFRSFYLLNRADNTNASNFVQKTLEPKWQNFLKSAKYKTNFIKIK